jgi:predicted ATPase
LRKAPFEGAAIGIPLALPEDRYSVRGLRLPLDACSVFVGANGVGKTNLYKAVAPLRAADGTITRAIAEEGGIQSAMWAGDRPRGKQVRLILKAHFDELVDRADALPYVCQQAPMRTRHRSVQLHSIDAARSRP